MGFMVDLEEFSLPPNAWTSEDGGADETKGAANEAKKNQAYEAGYKAGWEDAARAAAQEHQRIGADLAHNLRNLGFTFHEARSHVMSAVGPILRQLVEKLLPQILSGTLGARVVEEIEPLLDAAADARVEIAVAPQDMATLEKLAGEDLPAPFTLRAEPSLAGGQVHLRLGRHEKQIDLDGVLNKVTAALNAVLEENEKVLRHE